jgi:hypothetical protein
LHPAFWLGFFDGDGSIFVGGDGMHSLSN